MHIALSRTVVGQTLPDVPDKSFGASPDTAAENVMTTRQDVRIVLQVGISGRG